jgi:hypothetical protein
MSSSSEEAEVEKAGQNRFQVKFDVCLGEVKEG